MTRSRLFNPIAIPRGFAVFVWLLSVVASGPAGAIETNAKQAIMVDAETGTVLLEKDADQLVPPSSMSKMMTVYVVFERLKEKSLSLIALEISRLRWIDHK